MIAATAMLFGGCGEDKTKSDKKGATKATVSATETVSPTAPTTALSTLTPAPIETLAPQNDDDPTEVQSDNDGQQDYYNAYGGLSGQEAILKALSYVGAGYQCVYYDRQYLHNQEAWYIGIQASEGTDSTVYYLYVNENECVPVSEIPNIGGNNSEDSGVFEPNYAGISEQEAIFAALGSVEGEYACVSSEQAGIGATEYWRIGIQQIDDPSADILYFFVNSDNCFQE